MQDKWVVAFIGVVVVGFVWLLLGGSGDEGSGNSAVREEEGIQVIRIFARGGYSPRQVVAKAGKVTQLELVTKGTYDCTAAFAIPSLGYQKLLPPTGATRFDLPIPAAGSRLVGVCSMGMYSFVVKFE